MTPEQKQIEEIRSLRSRDDLWAKNNGVFEGNNAGSKCYKHVGVLLSILDNREEELAEARELAEYWRGDSEGRKKYHPLPWEGK